MRVMDGGAFPEVKAPPDRLATWEKARANVLSAGLVEGFTYRELRDGTGTLEAYCAARAYYNDALWAETQAFRALTPVSEPLPYPASADV